MFEHVTGNCNCSGKWCSSCGQVKCRSAFSLNRSAKDGLDNYCKICKSEWLKAYRRGNFDPMREQRELVKSSETYRHKGVVPVFDHIDDNCDCPGKRCLDCGQVKCYGAFRNLKNKDSGLQTYCRTCKRARNESERMREYRRTWHQDNAEHVQKQRKAYREANAESIRAYREQNADQNRERARDYARSHRQERTIHEATRRARKQQAGGTFTRREWEALCEYYDYTCLRCGRRVPDIELTVDHVIPLAMGGSNSIDNIQPLCRSCNSGKRIKIIDYRAKCWSKRG